MSLQPGARVGAYEIAGRIGAGGMGEVYRARDTRLHRDVAIKVLPPLFAADRDRLARFEREAQTLALLNHPNIAQIYGVVEDPAALVMELVDGEDLAQRIARGAVPIDEAVAIARQVAAALEAAHERGIVHRDLKPANIKVRADGTVKVLDFGLAKAAAAAPEPAGPGFAPANSPTFTSPALLTNMGLILGTAAYMSPEQAKGKPVDRRADMWAFGVVLFEMLTGRTAFDGETVTDVLAAVVTRDPDWTQLPAAMPPGIRRLLARCLSRDPRNRLADAGEARHQIEDALAMPASVAAPVVAAHGVRSRGMLIAWLAVAVVAGVAAWLVWERPRTPKPIALRYSVEVPPKMSVNLVARPSIALSADGTILAYVATSSGTPRIFIRRRTEFDSAEIAGTEGASEPVFSPDGRWIAFFAGNKLNKVPVAGGTVEPIAEVNDPRGLSWDVPDLITYSPESVGPVFEIAFSGGAPKALTALVTGVERTHRWAQRLPGGATMFTVGSLTSPDNYDNASIEVVLSKTGERKVLVKGASMARYVPPGYLLFVHGTALFAQPFDADRLAVSGTPVMIAKTVAGDATTGASNFAFAAGTFAYVPGASATAQHRLVWMDRTGRPTPATLQPGMYFDVALSPDGGRAALTAAGSGGIDVWVYDFTRQTFTRLTFSGSHRTPVWSHDGAFVYYVALAPDGSSNTVMRKSADGSREEEPIATLKVNTFLRDVSPDGRLLLIDHSTNVAKSDISTLAAAKDAKPANLVATPFDEYAVHWSPDRRFIAYQSDESSRPEIYVREASGQGGRWQVSTQGGEEPRWSADGRQLYYRADTQMMVVPIEPGPTFRNGPARLLFDGLYNLRVESGISYDVDAKSGRFLMIRLADDVSPATSIRVALNWTSELASLVQGK